VSSSASIAARLLLGVVLGLAAALLRLVLGLVASLLLELVLGVGILAELVAVAELVDDPAGEAGEGLLVVEHRPDPFERPAGVALQEAAPEPEHVLRALRQLPPGGELAHHVAGGLGERRLAGVGDLAVAAAARLLGDLGVDVAGGARHRPRPHRLAARRLHRLEERRGGLAGGRVAAVRRVVVVAQPERVGVGGAAGEQHLVTGQPPRHLRQPHRAGREARRVDREGHGQLRLARHRARRLGERLLERVGRVVGGLVHCRRSSWRPSVTDGPWGNIARPGAPRNACRR
jgi:hypothetical protein